MPLWTACERTSDSGPPARQSSASVGGRPRNFAPWEPAVVVQRVNDLRRSGRLLELQDHVVSEQRSAVHALVSATDALLNANARLQDSIIQTYGHAAAIPFDRSEASNAIGVFSSEVTVLDQRIDGDRAAVTIQVAHRVPVQEVALVLRRGRWLVHTDPPIEELPREVRRLAEVLEEAADRVIRENLTIEQIEGMLSLAQEPILRRIQRLTSTGP